MSVIEIARAIAYVAHDGQTDKAGEPYIKHPMRVAARLEGKGSHAISTAWLHDVIEDTKVTEQLLIACGVQQEIVRAVRLLTRFEGQDDRVYYANIHRNPVALAVKLADIEDNTDPMRLAKLDEKTQLRLIQKYAKAREQLGVGL